MSSKLIYKYPLVLLNKKKNTILRTFAVVPVDQLALSLTFLLSSVSSAVPMVRTFAVSGLDAGKAYELRVTAHNSAGATSVVYSVTTAGSVYLPRVTPSPL